MPRTTWSRKAIGKDRILAAVALFVCLVPAYGQYEITPLVGARFGGTIELEQAGMPNASAHLTDSISYGVAGGYRFAGEEEGHSLIEFRWMRQNTHLALKQDPLVPTPFGANGANSFRPAITLDHFLADFTYEYHLEDAPKVQPFVTFGLGAALMSAPAASATRFMFGIGGGVKVFPSPHWGVRFEVEYLPIVMHGEIQSIVCTGGCVVALNGGVMNQFQVSVGPAFRF